MAIKEQEQISKNIGEGKPEGTKSMNIKLSSEENTIQYDEAIVKDAIENQCAEGKEYDEKFFEDFLNSFKSVSEIEESEPEWIAPGIIPKGTITLLASEGGIGKTTTWVNLLAALSSGKKSIFDSDDFQGREPMRIAYLSSEDSSRYQIKRKLINCGANEENIITYDEKRSDVLHKLKLGTPHFSKFISYFKPELVVLDPLQGFLNPKMNMGSRNEIRDALQSLMSLGETFGTTFLIVCHANKRAGAYGRTRLSDSSDLWDAARSVLMAGFTEDNDTRYISHEKSNYAPPVDTFLYHINDDGKITITGRTKKKDRDFQQAAFSEGGQDKSTKVDVCGEDILNYLHDNAGKVKNEELDSALREMHYSSATVRRAKENLKSKKKIFTYNNGYGKEKAWYTVLGASLLEQVKEGLPSDIGNEQIK